MAKASKAAYEKFKRLHVRMRIADAETFAEKHAADMVTRISGTTREAIKALIARATREGITPYDTARLIRELVGLTPQGTQAVMNYRANLMRMGGSIDRIDAAVSKYAAKKLRERATTIARTEIMGALNGGLLDEARQAMKNGKLGKGAMKEWMAAGGCCVLCADLDGDRVPLKDPFTTGVDAPPLHPRCLSGDSFVFPVGRVSASSERWYEGDFIVARTTEGHRLSCTPNHPVLTASGWVAAGLLNVGDDVISLRRSDWEAAIYDNHENVPASIKDIARSVQDLPQARAATVPMTPEHFHGDGRGSEVATVWTDGFLGNDDKPPFGQEVAKESLSSVHGSDSLPSDSRTDLSFERDRCPACGRMGRGNLLAALSRSHSTPLKGLALSLAARFNPSLKKHPADTGSGDAEAFRYGEFRLPGQVQLDRVISIERSRFSGHVFNLQTMSGLYIAGVIVSNCRCTFDVLPPERGEPGYGEKQTQAKASVPVEALMAELGGR